MPNASTKGTYRRVLTIFARGTLTLAVVGISGLAILIGVDILGDRAAAIPEPEAAAPVPVSVGTLRIEPGYALPRRFIGQIEARANLSLSFELGGRLDALLVEEGDVVTAGQELARLDTDLLEAEAQRLRASRAAAAAQLSFAEARLERAVRLQEQGFTSQETLDQALAARDELTNLIAETDAALQSVAINVEKSVLYAPVSGQVGAQSADVAETVQAGQQIVTVMETAQPELRVGLPLSVDAEALQNVQIEVAGRSLPAKLKRLRPDIDPVTRTRTALFSLETGADVLFGQTATLVLETTVAASGAWLPLDALQSGNGSVWTVMIVVDGKLRQAAVEILHLDRGRAFVRGTLQEGDQIVLSGAHRVVAGQSVAVIASEG